MNLLCIDYGTKHIGLATATTPLAEPLKTIPEKNSHNLIRQLIAQNEIDQIIVGLPDGPIRENVDQFVSSLKSQVSTPVIFHDETLSSQEAKLALLHKRQSVRVGFDHHFAAALILQNWLDTPSPSGHT